MNSENSVEYFFKLKLTVDSQYTYIGISIYIKYDVYKYNMNYKIS